MPLIKSQKLKDKKAAEQEAIRQMYKTHEYTVRDLATHFMRSKQYVMNAIHAVDKSAKKPLTKKYKK